MTEPPRALRPSDYTDGRPDLDHLFPFVGGTLAQQRGTIALRKKVWAEQSAAVADERIRVFFEGRDQRAAEHAANPEHR